MGVGVSVGVGVGVGAASSFVIVKTAVAGAPWIAAPIALLSVRLTVSSPSKTLSSQIGTLKVLLVSPAAKLNVEIGTDT